MSSSYIYRIYTTEDNYITLPSEIGYVRLRLRGHPVGKHNSADVYIVLKYEIDLEDDVINFNEIPESFQQDLLDEFLHIQGDEQENGDVLRFNLYEAYLPEHIIKETFDMLVYQEEQSPYSVRWNNFALSFFNGEEFDENIANAIKEIVVVSTQTGNGLGIRKRRKRKSTKRKSKRKKSKRRKSKRRKTRKNKRKKKRK